MSSDPQIQEIKDKLDLVELISEYVTLNRSGNYFKARCPFHQEKTPSFMVSPDRDRWHCFGCSEGGDGFTFLQKIEGLDFPEALSALAQRTGVVLKKRSPQDKKQADALQRVYNCLFDAASVYQIILRDADGAQEARAYVESRGVNKDTQAAFMVGFAPEKWDVLYQTLSKRGYDVSDLLKAGLVIKSDRGGFYDRFRDRIMFPIFDHHGRVVGFTGRMLHNTQKGGKYVNTPQTPVFDKSRLLYGLDRAAQSIRKAGKAIIVEGQMDVIASHQAGIENTVASSGTALGEAQLKLLKRYATKLKMAFDTDEAGQKAARRGIELALSLGFEVFVIELKGDDGKDPDDCISKSVEVWKQRVDEAIPFVQWAINMAVTNFDIASARGKKQAADDVMGLIVKIPSVIEQDHWMRSLSSRLSIALDVLRSEYGNKVAVKASRQTQKTEKRSSAKKNPFVLLLALFVRLDLDKALLDEFDEQFYPQALHPLVKFVKTGYTDDTTIEISNVLLMRVELAYPSFSTEQLHDEFSDVREYCSKQLLQRRIASIAHHIRDAEARGDNDRVAQLLEVYTSLREKSGA